MEKRVEYDVWYIENWNFMLDMKIIFLTLIGIFKGDKNAFWLENVGDLFEFSGINLRIKVLNIEA